MQKLYFYFHYTDPQIPHNDSLLTKVNIRMCPSEECRNRKMFLHSQKKKEVIQNRQHVMQQFRDKVIKTLISGSYVEVPSFE